MWPPWLRKDAPSARARVRASLDGHALRFRKLSDDGSTKADVSVARGCRVWGGLFDIDTRDLRRLNKKEGGYDPVPVAVRQTDGDVTDAWTFVARAARGRSRRWPYRWYLDLVRAGAAYFTLPDVYRRTLKRRRGKIDRDEERLAAATRYLSKDPGPLMLRR